MKEEKIMKKKAMVTVCDTNKVRNLRGLPDAPYIVRAILTKDTYEIAVYYEDGDSPAIMNVSAACRALGCFPSEVMIIEWGGELERVYDGAPWVTDDYKNIVHTKDDDDRIHIVDDFGDLF
jgi:hypothetical protein